VEKSGYVFSYVNPDTDGVACSLAYAALRTQEKKPVFLPLIWGSLNAETKLVLDNFNIAPPSACDELDPTASVVLVDTHHPQQLSPKVNLLQVVEIIDHHPAGQPEAFPNARIQNEAVGAAATLVTERFMRLATRPQAETAGVLAAAIVSNTYNMASPSTTARDHAALAWLKRHTSFDPTLPEKMLASLSSTQGMTTPELLRENYKTFRIGVRMIGIVQVETALPFDVLNRVDLLPVLSALRGEEEVSVILLSVVDLATGTTKLVVPDQATEELVEAALGFHFEGSQAAVPRLLMRKTDLVPGFEKYLAGHGNN
jgi:manganese-dependent inorganic pyrophosphatase